MTIREFIDRLMLEVGDVKGEKMKHAEYFIIGTEALKTVEAVYRPLFTVEVQTPSSDTAEITISNTPDKKFFSVGRVSVNGIERYNVDYEYVKLNSSTFLPVYGFKVDGASIKIAFSPVVPAGGQIKAICYYVHSTDYFTNEMNELELPENYVLIALNIAKQYIYAKLGSQIPQEVIPVQQGQQE